jgi:hypothetical protein
MEVLFSIVRGAASMYNCLHVDDANMSADRSIMRSYSSG